MSAILRRDPGTFVLAFAVWAALSAASLLVPGDAFRLNPIYGDVRQFGVVDIWWGAGMLADAVLLALTAVWGSAGVRAFTAIGSAPPWFFYGALLLAGAARAGLLSAGGAFDIVGAIGLAAAGAQWAHTLAPPASPRAVEEEPWI